jgi:hypothetical protein
MLVFPRHLDWNAAYISHRSSLDAALATLIDRMCAALQRPGESAGRILAEEKFLSDSRRQL